jgi:hypothetical protein
MDWLGAIGGILDILMFIGVLFIGVFQYFASIYGDMTVMFKVKTLKGI